MGSHCGSLDCIELEQYARTLLECRSEHELALEHILSCRTTVVGRYLQTERHPRCLCCQASRRSNERSSDQVSHVVVQRREFIQRVAVVYRAYLRICDSAEHGCKLDLLLAPFL